MGAQFNEPDNTSVQMKICYRWKSFKFMKYNNQKYMCHYNFGQEENLFECKYNNNSIYLLNTDDPSVNIFICESQFQKE